MANKPCKTCKKSVTNNISKNVTNVTSDESEEIHQPKAFETSDIPEQNEETVPNVPLIPVYSMTSQDKIDIEIGAIMVLYSEFKTGYDYKYLIVKHLVNIFKYNEKYKRELYKLFICPFVTDSCLDIQKLVKHFYGQL
jgi:hypothetical protein